jgi:hypothetical protein
VDVVTDISWRRMVIDAWRLPAMRKSLQDPEQQHKLSPLQQLVRTLIFEIPTSSLSPPVFHMRCAALCGYTIRASNGTFSSPGFPVSYPPGSVCIWHIIAPNNHYSISLNFTYFDLEGGHGVNVSSPCPCAVCRYLVLFFINNVPAHCQILRKLPQTVYLPKSTCYRNTEFSEVSP